MSLSCVYISRVVWLGITLKFKNWSMAKSALVVRSRRCRCHQYITASLYQAPLSLVAVSREREAGLDRAQSRVSFPGRWSPRDLRRTEAGTPDRLGGRREGESSPLRGKLFFLFGELGYSFDKYYK